jgi:hypothetical protein
LISFFVIGAMQGLTGLSGSCRLWALALSGFFALIASKIGAERLIRKK